MKRNGLYVIVGVLVVILVLEGIFLATMDRMSNSNKGSQTNSEDNSNDILNNNIKVSMESIRELAKNKDLYIMIDGTLFEGSKDILIDDCLLDVCEIDGKYNGLILSLKAGALYLKDNFNHESKILDLDEVVVMAMVRNSCFISAGDVLILTENGNLFLLEGNVDGKIDKVIYDKLQNNESVTLNLKQINSSDVKVLGFVEVYGDNRGVTCGSKTQYIYTNKGFMDYKDCKNGMCKVADRVIVDYCGWGVYDNYIDGFVVFNDGTVSVNGVDLIKNKIGDNLIVKSYYHGNKSDTEREMYYILGDDDYLYIENFDGSITISDSKVMNVSKEDGKVIFKFLDGSNVEVILKDWD